MESETCVEPVQNISSESVVTDIHGNAESDCLRRRKRKRKVKNRSKKQPKDSDHDHLGEASSMKTASVETKSCVESVINPKTDSKGAEIVSKLGKTLKRRKKKGRRETKHNAAQKNDNHSPEATFETNCILAEMDSSLLLAVDICSKNELETEQPNAKTGLSTRKNKRKKQKNKHNALKKNYSDHDLPVTTSKEEEVVKCVPDVEFDHDKQSGGMESANTSFMKYNNDGELDGIPKTRGERGNFKTYCRRSKNTSESQKYSSEPKKLFVVRQNCSDEAHTSGPLENKVETFVPKRQAAPAKVLEKALMENAKSVSPVDELGCKGSNKKKKLKNVQQTDSEDNLKWDATTYITEHFKLENSSKLDKNLITEQPDKPCCKEVTSNLSGYGLSHEHFDLKNKEIIPVKEDNLPQTSTTSLERAGICSAKKKLLILDVNGLLADIVPYVSHGYNADIFVSRKAVFKRPFCDDFLHFCFERFNVGVWSSRTKRNVDKVVDFLMGDSRRNLLFCWDQSHCTDTGFSTVENRKKPLVLKEIKKLWEKLNPDLPWEKGEYDESNTLLLDDSPYKALCNPAHTAIFPHSYQYTDANDSSLGPGGDLRVYLEGLAGAENVQKYVEQNPFGQRAITESSSSWGFYCKVLKAKSGRSKNYASEQHESVACQ